MKIMFHIPGLTDKEIAKMKSVFEVESGIAEVVLYGSRAKGNYRPGSDIDLTLKGRDLTERQLVELSIRLDDLLLPYEIDLSIFEHIDNPDLTDHINRLGKAVFCNE